MKSFYGQMNQGREPDRAGRWLSHRQEIQHLIKSSMVDPHPKDEVIILGAGNCDDFDLYDLAERFHAIILADIDNDSMQAVVKVLDPQLQLRIKCLDSLDFTGLDKVNFYTRFQSLLDNQAPAIRLNSFLKEIAVEVAQRPVLTHLKKRFAAVISSAVHTQLFYLHALSVFAIYAKLYVKNDVKQIVDGIAELRDFLLCQYNEMLFSLVRLNGAVIMWTDIVLLDAQTEFIKEMIYTLSNETERAQFMLRIMGSYGIESAVFALQDMHDRMAVDGKLLRSWIWPFNSEKQFITVGISGRARDE
jgi:hypothetical protein